jgi:cytosine/adenosine deaminase-related metal-dependent hydrolase
LIRYRAEWVLPIADAPIRDGWVSVEGGRVTGVGADPPGGCVDLGRTAVLPALVNAHTHLELSYLRGRVPRGGEFTDWIRTLMALRRQFPDPRSPEILAAARAAIDEARASGTGLFGDISNTLISVPLLREAGTPAHVFYELLGFNAPDPAGRVQQARRAVETLKQSGPSPDAVRISLAPHAPYSVSPVLFGAIRADLDSHKGEMSSVHLGESAAEVEFLQTGGGVFRALLEELGVWADEWQPPGVSPVEYLSNLGFIDSRVIVVHGVQFDGDDLKTLSGVGATLVSCPRSNQYVGVGAPPLEAFYAMDVNVAFGTDSLASAADLNMFAELAEARRLAPRVPARRLLESATLTGARALGFGEDMGSIERGKRALLIAVRVPPDVADVEEYLVSAVEREVAWLDHGSTADAATSIVPS